MSDAVSQLGVNAIAQRSAEAAGAQAGVSVVAQRLPLAGAVQGGVTAVAARNVPGALVQAGVHVWARVKLPYAVGQLGAAARTQNNAPGGVAQAGASAFAYASSMAALGQAGVMAWVRFVPAALMAATVQAPARRPGTPIDIQVAYDAQLGCCDVVFNGTDFALDETPASVLLLSLLNERRAHPDDTWPQPVPDWANPNSLNARRGWVGDALDPNGQRAGSRLWELDRRLEDEQTRSDCQAYLVEALEPLEAQRNYALQIAVSWVASGILGYRVRAGNTAVSLKKALN